MKKFLLGLVTGTGLGWYFNDVITDNLRRGVKTTNEKLDEFEERQADQHSDPAS